MTIKIEEIKKIAQRAGEEIMKYYETDSVVTYKKGDKNSPLTKADLASNKIICDALKKYGWPILSEESTDDKSRLNSEYVWIVDPLDGTSDFIGKTKEFCVIIALIKNNQPILGIIYEPAISCFYYAEAEKGAIKETGETKERITVSQRKNFPEMKIFVSRSHPGKKEIIFSEKARIDERIICGSAGVKICQITEGKGDIYINSSGKSSEWDTCAGALILREAGGKITDMDGNDLTYNNENPRHLRGYAASNGTRQDDIIKALKTL